MVDAMLIDLRKRLNPEIGHKAFLDDFAGWPKTERSRLIRLVADDDGVLPFLDLFVRDLVQGPTKAENERMTFLGALLRRLASEGSLAAVVAHVAGECENAGTVGAGEFPELLPVVAAIADLYSPAEAPAQSETLNPLAEVIERTGSPTGWRQDLPFGATYME